MSKFHPPSQVLWPVLISAGSEGRRVPVVPDNSEFWINTKLSINAELDKNGQIFSDYSKFKKILY